ncbi:diacylglycerol kinase [Actinacidiphila yanglinensis]|uniref:Diacylglycerol kinase n=1 Tax=Actinacidiphila yanglinensis TaxID=310779 RepID=A0A1H6B361_9ACTN|nr:diacylglycerol kinase [Actinacidiphila yanglinensis]SEG54546.1 diacylglycerol kinase [Actinacidiphila yanglinensis]
MTSEITLLVNPSAGRGRGARAAEPAVRVLRAAGLDVRTVVGADADDALARARAAVATGTRAVVALGGDGMVSLALQAVAGTGTPLGVVAVGTGNDFARVNGLPVRDPAAAASVVAQALGEDRTRLLDLGRVGPGPDGDRWFGTVLASGFDSRVNDRGNRMRFPGGRFRYDVAMLAELAALRPIPYRVSFDDAAEREMEVTLIAVGNGSSYGGGMRICADAVMDDGLFDVCVVGPCSRTTLLRVFPLVYSGTHPSHPVVTVHRAARVRLTAAGVTGYADGEPIGPLPLTARTVPGALRLLV